MQLTDFTRTQISKTPTGQVRYVFEHRDHKFIVECHRDELELKARTHVEALNRRLAQTQSTASQ